MTATPDTPAHDGSDLEALREEIDRLKAIPHEELVNPTPGRLSDREPIPHPTDAIGSEDWDAPESDETHET